MQAVMAHSRLLKRGGYAASQLLFGHEPAPKEGEALDDERRSITVSMAERLAKQQSAMEAWCKPKPSPASNEHKTVAHELFITGPLELLYGTGEPTFRVWVLCPRFDKDLPHFGTNKGAWLGPATVLAQEMGRSQEQREEAHGSLDRGTRSSPAMCT